MKEVLRISQQDMLWNPKESDDLITDLVRKTSHDKVLVNFDDVETFDNVWYECDLITDVDAALNDPNKDLKERVKNDFNEGWAKWRRYCNFLNGKFD